jgi:hypothetical protein
MGMQENKKLYIKGYITHLKQQIEEYGKNTEGLEENNNKKIAAFEKCQVTNSKECCNSCIMAKVCGYSPKNIKNLPK